MIISIMIVMFLFSTGQTTISRNEDIAGSKPAYQETTSGDNHIAIKAVQTNNEASTFTKDRDFARYWWVVDLKGYYHITEVCLFNKVFGGNWLVFN